MQQRRAFTIVELLTAISVLAILSALVVVGFNRSRQSSRDSRRKSDVSEYSAGMQLYHTYKGSYFVTADGSNCNSKVACTTGADGDSYGRINYSAGKTAGGIQYGDITISTALKAGGFISSIGRDPQDNGTGSDQPDYVLVRCLTGGAQVTSSHQDDGFAIWARLESTIDGSSSQYLNSSHYCGGSTGTARYTFGYTNNEDATNNVFPSPRLVANFEADNAYFSSGDGAFASNGTNTPGNPTPTPSPSGSGTPTPSGSPTPTPSGTPKPTANPFIFIGGFTGK